MISSDKLEMETRLAAPALPAGHGLYPVLASALKSRPAPTTEALPDRPFWPASYFGLEQVAIYRDSDEAEQLAILLGSSHGILADIYYIEKCGMYFASKMCLLSESTQERMLYSLFAADEAVHFNWISSYVPAESVQGFESNPFIRLIDEVLQKEDRATLSYVVQIILEGWGISYYQALAKHCLDESLTAVFQNIIRDEGRHHASGLTLFNQYQHSPAGLKRLTDVLAQLLLMVQAGPQMVVSDIERVKGHLSEAQKTQIFAELDCETTTRGRIKTIKSLIKTAACSRKILSDLERKGSFRAYTASECAAASG